MTTRVSCAVRALALTVVIGLPRCPGAVAATIDAAIAPLPPSSEVTPIAGESPVDALTGSRAATRGADAARLLPRGFVRNTGARTAVLRPGAEAVLALIAPSSRAAAGGPVAVNVLVLSSGRDGALRLSLLRLAARSGPMPQPVPLPHGLPRMVAAALYPATVLPTDPALP